MALGGLPPWLNIQPTDYLQATQSGTQAGLNIAEMRQRAIERAQAMAEARARRQQEAWEFGERMRQAAAEQAAMAQYRQDKLTQDREEGLSMMDFRNRQLAEQGMRGGADDDRLERTLAETVRHNKEMEKIREDGKAKGEYDIIEDPRVPGVKFLQQPSGQMTPVERPQKELTQEKRDEMAMRAFRLMQPSASEFADSPSYTSRTNFVGPLLERYTSPAPPSGGTRNEVIRKTRDGRQAVFDADTKAFIRYAD